jgi:hypothetical protein
MAIGEGRGLTCPGYGLSGVGTEEVGVEDIAVFLAVVLGKVQSVTVSVGTYGF